jgi:hypothetical protein
MAARPAGSKLSPANARGRAHLVAARMPTVTVAACSDHASTGRVAICRWLPWCCDLEFIWTPPTPTALPDTTYDSGFARATARSVFASTPLPKPRVTVIQ